MAVALANAGRLEESRAALLEVVELVPPGPARLELVCACARVELQLGRQREARRRLTAAMRDATPAGQAAIAFELAADAMTHGRSADLRAWADRARRLAAGVDPVVHAAAATLGALGAVWTGGPPSGSACLDDLDAGGGADVLVHVGRAQLRLGRFADAEATMSRALAEGPPQEQLQVWLRVVRAWARVQLLDLDGALEDVDAAEEMARLQAVPLALLLVLCKRMLVQHHRGDALDAERAAAECAAIAATLEPSAFTAHAACHAAEVRVAQDPERCIREVTASAGPELEATDPSLASATRLLLVRAAVAAGRVDEAERWARDAEERAARLRLPVAAARAACARAEILLASGAATHAAERALEAAAAADVDAPLDAAEARLLAGRALAVAGDPAAAGALLRRVAADAGGAGALRLRDAAARELRRIGSRVPAGARGAARRAPLTERERRIAELVTQGHSNKQVAATLFLSEKTVANSLTRVYAKLGVRSRVDLTRELAA